MKNMKKLLGALAALGLSTVAAVNVVACGSSTATNDLTKSYNSSYTTLIQASNAAGLAAIGLTMVDANTFTLKFASITDAGIQAVIEPISANVPVNAGVTVATTLPAAAKAGDEIAQVVAKTADGNLTASSAATKTVSFSVTLKLFKADSTMKYQDQSTSMDVMININTVLQKIDISSGVSITDPGTIAANGAMKYSDLNTNTDIADLVTMAINEVQENTNAALTTDFTLTNDQTATSAQAAGVTVTFTVTATATSTVLVANKTFTFAIKLIAPVTTVDISTASVTDPGNINANTAATYGALNTDTGIAGLVTAAINAVQANTNAALTTDFTLTNDQTAGDNQVSGTKVTFTVSVAAGSAKLTQGKTFSFAIVLQ